MRTPEKTGYSPEDIINLALQGNDQFIQKRRKSEREDKLYEAAHKNPNVLIKEAAQSMGVGQPDTPVDPSFGPAPTAPARGSALQTMVQQAAAARGWQGGEWDALYDLISKESSWDPNAHNPSGASSIFQFMPNTARDYGLPSDARRAPTEQLIDAGLRYIEDRYQTPSGALRHWLAREPINGKDVGNWY